MGHDYTWAELWRGTAQALAQPPPVLFHAMAGHKQRYETVMTMQLQTETKSYFELPSMGE